MITLQIFHSISTWKQIQVNAATPDKYHSHDPLCCNN